MNYNNTVTTNGTILSVLGLSLTIKTTVNRSISENKYHRRSCLIANQFIDLHSMIIHKDKMCYNSILTVIAENVLTAMSNIIISRYCKWDFAITDFVARALVAMKAEGRI